MPPYGIFLSPELDTLLTMLEEYKVSVIRLTRDRNIILFIPEKSVYDFYLKFKALNKNYTGESFPSKD